MSTALITSASFVAILLSLVALIVPCAMAMHSAVERQTPYVPWTKVGLLVGTGFLAFSALLTLSLKGREVLVERRDRADAEARQALYDACLTRTTPEVCEVHWVRLTESVRDNGGPTLVITPDGKIGTGFGL